MICKDNQKLIDALLRLKSNEDLSINAINQIMDQGMNMNKIASVQVQQETNTKTKKVGELVDFQRLLKSIAIGH